MTYFIASLIEGDVSNLYKMISTEVSKKFAVMNISETIPCHITLKYPFEADGHELIRIRERVRTVASTKNIVPFSIQEFGSFDKKVIYFSVEKDLSLVTLLKQCREELGDFSENTDFNSHEYHPHITVARKITPHIFPEVLSFITNTYPLGKQALLNNISILVERDGVWSIVETAYFKD